MAETEADANALLLYPYTHSYTKVNYIYLDKYISIWIYIEMTFVGLIENGLDKG
jgi:hypothetical protein